MKVSIIVAVAENGVIGRDNDLPWRLSADLKRFKTLTMGHHLLMGRKTFDSIGRPLPGREMIVVSRGDPVIPEGVHVSATVEDGLERARSYGEDEIFVAGGASIYAATLPLASRMYLTWVRAEVAGDVYFPELDLTAWTEVSCEEIEAGEANEYPTAFCLYERVDTG